MIKSNVAKSYVAKSYVAKSYVAKSSVAKSSIVALLCVLCGDWAAAQSRKPTSDEWDRIRPLFKLVEDVASGKPAPADVALTWACHYLDAKAGVVLVPFTIGIERGAFTSFPLAMYVRVVTRGAPAPAPGPRDALAQYPFEDAAIVGRPSDGRISRAFAAPPGDYDVYLALAEPPTAGEAQPRTVVLKKEVTVPDLKSDLAVSSIILADTIEVDPTNRRLDFEEQLDEPYHLWGNRITPAIRNTFSAHEKLSVIFLVYNTGASADGKPDVEVQYIFHQQTAGAETFFIKTRPELFNARTLRPEFSLAAGDLIIAGQQMSLARFPEGEYRLEIGVTDNIAGKSLTRDVNFIVK